MYNHVPTMAIFPNSWLALGQFHIWLAIDKFQPGIYKLGHFETWGIIELYEY